MSNAQVLADFLSTTCDGVATMLIYADGLVVWLAVSDRTQAMIKRKLRRRFGPDVIKEEARSKDGFGGVLILRPKDWEELGLMGDYPSMTADTVMFGEALHRATGHELTYKDNREMDLNTIGLFAAFLAARADLTMRE